MKNMKLNYLLSLVLAVILLAGCGGLNKMSDKSNGIKYTVVPSPLELKGGKVDVKIDGTFPEKYFNKKAIVVATPVLNYEGGKVAYDTTGLQGESVEGNNKVIPYTGGSFSYSGSVDYAEGMMVSTLDMQMYAQVKKKKVDFAPVKIADGVIVTPLLVVKKAETILVKDNFQRITPETYEADIHYVINQAEVRPSELKGEDVQNLQKQISTLKVDTNKQVKGASISAYASPDGPEELNTKLADKREETSKSFLTKELKKSKVDAGDDFLQLMATPEDWDGFKKLMEASTIQDKELILRVLSMYSDPVVREKEIKNIAAAYDEIKEQILPQLRRAKMILNVEVVGRSDEQIIALARTTPDTLSLEEILYAATLTSDLAEKEAIYAAASKHFPECYRAANNLGYIQLQLGKVAEAKANFEKAKAINDCNEVRNNLGAIAMAEGDLAKAEELFTSAMGAGSAPSYNLGIIMIIKGDYKAAVNYFGSKPSFNAALAQLLNLQFDAAMATLGNIENPDAMVYYLKAVASARSAKDDVALSNLRTAVGMDSNLKAYAKKDLEFYKLRTNEAFTSIVQ
jgi:Flp pilus assembly protein TadD